MIRHIVLVRFALEVDSEQRDVVIDALRALQSSVPGVRSFTGGENISQEGRSAGFTHAFVMDFDSTVERDAYLNHPAHIAAATKLVAAADGESGILVVDIDPC